MLTPSATPAISVGGDETTLTHVATRERQIHPTVRLNFLVRVTTYPLFLIVYLMHLIPRGMSIPVWILFITHLVLWPHIARWVASRSSDTKAAELRNLLVDSFLIGVYVPISGYSLWPNAAGFVAFHAGNLSVGGPRFALRGLVTYMVGFVVAALITQTPLVVVDTSLQTQSVSIAAIALYVSVFGLHSYQQSQRVVRRNRQIREQAAELEERGRQLEQARDAAESANSAKSNFLANMSHELRTPLNAIIGYSEMLIEEAEDVDAETFIPDLEKIRSSGKHLLGLINDVLDLSKIEAGKMQLYLEDFDVREMLTIAASTVEPLAKKNGSTLTVVASPDLGRMHADLTRVRQILLNLLSNACKFTEKGRITLSAVREHTPRGDRIIFTVSDSGIGMTPEQVGKLFHPFTQADASTTRKYGGTGLGLTITKHFVEMMGGSVRADSAPGRGTIFTVRLPAEVHEQSSIDEAITTRRLTQTFRIPLPAELEAGNILVIDDDPATRELVQRSLEREGFAVECAASGEEGIRMARESRPDAITLDVLMPGRDGWSVLSALKADKELSAIPVVMLSGVYDKPLADALGAAAYLTKPLDRTALLTTLRNAVAPAAPNGERVLVVEDDAIARELLVRTLERQGYFVTEAIDGQDGLDKLEEAAPALILLDLMMPRVDGFAFLEQLRHFPQWRRVPVVIVSGKSITDDERERLQSAAAILTKGSHSQQELLRVVDASVREKVP